MNWVAHSYPYTGRSIGKEIKYDKLQVKGMSEKDFKHKHKSKGKKRRAR